MSDKSNIGSRAKIYGKGKYHIEIDGIIFKSSGFVGGASVGAAEAYDKKRREAARDLVTALNSMDLVRQLELLKSRKDTEDDDCPEAEYDGPDYFYHNS